MTALTAAELPEVHSVYLLPMGGGLDQFLASRLTQENVFQVVADPKAADALLTDRIGTTFEKQVEDLYAPPKEKAPQSGKMGEPPPVRPFMSGVARGTIFLVDRTTKRILWSTVERAKSTRAQDLDRAADHIVDDLQKAVGKK